MIDGALASAGIGADDVAAIGVTNQRETTLVWDRETGEPIHNAIVWQDTRTAALVRELAGQEGPDRLREDVGLPLSTLLLRTEAHVAARGGPRGARARAEAGELAFGTMDSWILWKLTGGPAGGVHATDVTNASRTMMMDLESLAWHEPSLSLMGIPPALLPEIRSSSEVYGEARGDRARAGGRWQRWWATSRRLCSARRASRRGEAKNTYGTGAFLLVNTGEEIVRSPALLTSVAAKVGAEPTSYVLEGSIAVTGAAVQWLRDQLGLIETAAEVEDLARTVPDNGGVYFVPAFSGLFAPRWRDDARGVIVGLTAFATAGHIARATLEAAAWQTREVLDAIDEATGVPLAELKVDGGMSADGLLMQFQADVLGVPVVRPEVIETTALGAAFAAGLAVGFFADEEALRARWRADRRWEPQMDAGTRERELSRWRDAVSRSLDWVG